MLRSRHSGVPLSRREEPSKRYPQGYSFEPYALNPVCGHACCYHNRPLSCYGKSPTYGRIKTGGHPHILLLKWLNLGYGLYSLPRGTFHDIPRRSFAREIVIVSSRIQRCVGVFPAPETPARIADVASSLVHVLRYDNLTEECDRRRTKVGTLSLTE